MSPERLIRRGVIVLPRRNRYYELKVMRKIEEDKTLASLIYKSDSPNLQKIMPDNQAITNTGIDRL